MKLQHWLNNISTVSNAFEISNFVKREDKKSDIVYYFKSFQSIRKCKITGEFSYSKNLYGYDNGSSLAKYTFDAFKELMDYIDLNVDNNGNLVGVNVPKLGNSALQSAYNNNTSPIGYGISSSFNGFSSGLNIIEQNLYCVCVKPLITQSEAAGEKFDFCKCCKREKNDIKLKELFGSNDNVNKDSGYYGMDYASDDIPF